MNRRLNLDAVRSTFENMSRRPTDTGDSAPYAGTHRLLCYEVNSHYEIDRDENVLRRVRWGLCDGDEVSKDERTWSLTDDGARVAGTEASPVAFAREDHHDDIERQLIEHCLDRAPDTSLRIRPDQSERLHALKERRGMPLKDVLDCALWLAESLVDEPTILIDSPTFRHADGLSDETRETLHATLPTPFHIGGPPARSRFDDRLRGDGGSIASVSYERARYVRRGEAVEIRYTSLDGESRTLAGTVETTDHDEARDHITLLVETDEGRMRVTVDTRPERYRIETRVHRPTHHWRRVSRVGGDFTLSVTSG